jgi:hypothetical protein
MTRQPTGTAVKLSLIHTNERDPSKLFAAVSGGWPKSNLKSMLETAAAVLNESAKKSICAHVSALVFASNGRSKCQTFLLGTNPRLGPVMARA